MPFQCGFTKAANVDHHIVTKTAKSCFAILLPDPSFIKWVGKPVFIEVRCTWHSYLVF